MNRLTPISRRFVSCLILLMLALQGITQVYAAVQPSTHVQQHCPDHDPAEHCKCCIDELAMSGGCATLCSFGVVTAQIFLDISQVDSGHHSRLVISGARGPNYLPLHPPPIFQHR